MRRQNSQNNNLSHKNKFLLVKLIDIAIRDATSRLAFFISMHRKHWLQIWWVRLVCWPQLFRSTLPSIPHSVLFTDGSWTVGRDQYELSCITAGNENRFIDLPCRVVIPTSPRRSCRIQHTTTEAKDIALLRTIDIWVFCYDSVETIWLLTSPLNHSILGYCLTPGQL